MRKSIYEFELMNASLHARLQVVVSLLRKAQFLVIRRKQQIAMLKDQLDKKNQLLLEEMIAHEATNQKLANALRTLAHKYSHTIITTTQATEHTENISQSQ